MRVALLRFAVGALVFAMIGCASSGSGPGDTGGTLALGDAGANDTATREALEAISTITFAP